MRYGQIAENRSINALIYRCFEQIADDDARIFAKKFREQPHDEAQVMHTFRELILGGFLASNGLKVRYDPLICGKTPDWSVIDEKMMLQCAVELVNFHTDKKTEGEISHSLKTKNAYSGWTESQQGRLYERIREKASLYKELVGQVNIAYLIALFSETFAAIDIADVRECLFGREHGLFSLYPEASGFYFIEEDAGRYNFRYIENPIATRPINMPSGLF